MKRRRLVLAVMAAAAFLWVIPTAIASIFGEEDILLAEILAEITKSYTELREISDAAGDTVELAADLLDAYQRVNAGIDELTHYSAEEFLEDFRGDLYHLYPGLARIEHGTQRLQNWDRTHTSSPWTAYEAISALADDVSKPLREQIKAGRVSIDRELIRKREAAGGFALATVAEDSTAGYDRAIDELDKVYRGGVGTNPGKAQMVNAEATLLVAKQNSHIIRLLARGVRLEGVNQALRAQENLRDLNANLAHQEKTGAFAERALQPPRMMEFGE